MDDSSNNRTAVYVSTCILVCAVFYVTRYIFQRTLIGLQLRYYLGFSSFQMKFLRLKLNLYDYINQRKASKRDQSLQRVNATQFSSSSVFCRTIDFDCLNDKRADRWEEEIKTIIPSPADSTTDLLVVYNVPYLSCPSVYIYDQSSKILLSPQEWKYNELQRHILETHNSCCKRTFESEFPSNEPASVTATVLKSDIKHVTEINVQRLLQDCVLVCGYAIWSFEMLLDRIEDRKYGCKFLYLATNSNDSCHGTTSI